VRGDADRLLSIARALLPERPIVDPELVTGQFHDVVLVPGRAAVRVARHADCYERLARTTALLHRLCELDLPFVVPAPLSDVVEVDGRAAVATSWVPGAPSPRGVGDPRELREALDVLAETPVEALRPLLAEPHAYAGGARWFELMTEEAIPRLPASWQVEARRRVRAAHDLPDVPPSLVHGDLAGDNMRWDGDGRLVGILDWDLAAAWDPAVDAACLAWHGWDTVRAAVDATTYARARVWGATFGIEQIGAAIASGEPEEVIDGYVGSTVAWLERTST
jgi:aminoglycoside phosphotransferase (APT) family kinase protein